MLKQQLKLINKLGLHARAAMKLVNTAGRFQSEIMLNYNNRDVNAKSIMNVMCLAAPVGSDITLTIDGPDETDAMQALTDLINDRFGEEE